MYIYIYIYISHGETLFFAWKIPQNSRIYNHPPLILSNFQNLLLVTIEPTLKTLIGVKCRWNYVLGKRKVDELYKN